MEWLFALATLSLLIWGWTDILRARERAFFHAQRACRETGVQLLDETLALRRLGIARRGLNGLTLRRIYQFDFSVQGTDRLQGTVILLGMNLEGIMLDDGGGRLLMATKQGGENAQQSTSEIKSTW